MLFNSVTATSSLQLFSLVPWVVFFPVLGLLINVFLGGKILEKGVKGEKFVGWLASIATGSSFVVSILQAIALLGFPDGQVVPFADWITIGELQLRWSFQVDTLSVTMMLVVSGVGTLIHIYSIGYMHEDVRHNGDPNRFRRFFVFMNLFIASMMLLVSSDNYLMLFVGWEGVGLCSYLLIGFWYDKGKDGIGNAVAAKKALIVNRVGDFGFLIAAFLMFVAFGSFEFKEVFEQAPQVAQDMPGVMLAITGFLLLGVTGKSAQLPLYVWLPDAMAGPTPVSALIHAATMVTAGVYLVARSQALYIEVPQAQTLVTMVGALTALFAATIAVGQFDIKRVLAYSTISQLGFMVAAVGMGAVVAGMFHLVTHAFFKALLFLSAGSVIQGVERGHHRVEHDPGLKKHLKGYVIDPQDMRNMGGIKDKMKVTFGVYLIGALALAGIAPLAGFWSKDEILTEGLALNPTAYWLMTGAAFLTAFYMGRQVFMVFFGASRSLAAEHATESLPVITVPLGILAGLSVVGGFLNLPGVHPFTHWLGHTFEHLHQGEFNLFVALLSTALAFAAIFLAWVVYKARYTEYLRLPVAKRPVDPLAGIIGPLFTLFQNKYWVDEFYQGVIVGPYRSACRFLASVVDWNFWHDWFHDRLVMGVYNSITRILALPIDLGGIDAFFVGLGKIVRRLAASLRWAQTGYVRNYALSILLGVVLILTYLVFR